MEAIQNSTPERSISHKNKEKRLDNIRSLIDFQTQTLNTGSKRQAAKKTGVPRSTLQYREKKSVSFQGSSKEVEFLTSADGAAFLHRLVTALLLGVVELGGGGLRVVQTILTLSELNQYVASSVGSLHKLVIAMETAVVQFNSNESQRLSMLMPEKDIMVSSDETFPGNRTLLVGMELASNYILIEKLAPNRQFETWKQAWNTALADLPVNVIQSTSDEGSSIVKCTKDRLGAQHSPDLFHILQEISRGTSAPLSSKVKHYQVEHEKAVRQIIKCTQAKIRDESCTTKKPGKPIDHILRISKAEVDEDYAKKDLEDAQNRQTLMKDARKKISTCYHPIDLETGQPRTPEQLEQSLNEAFDIIEDVTESSELSENSIKRVEKARKMVDSMVSTLRFFWLCFEAHIKKYSLPVDLNAAFRSILFPAYYLQEVSRKAQDAESRQAFNTQSQALLAQLGTVDAWIVLSELEKEKYQKQARQCAQLFQRSSSCVEGRNGQLALKHHGLRQMGERKLAALTVIHNYFIKRGDGTTAAERFFENKPRDLFEYLIDHLDYPAAPAKRRKAA